MPKQTDPPEGRPLPIVAQLRQAIRGSGLSLNELGRRTGVTEGQLSRFLRGDRTLTLPAAAKVCLYLGLELRPKTREAKGPVDAPPATSSRKARGGRTPPGGHPP